MTTDRPRGRPAWWRGSLLVLLGSLSALALGRGPGSGSPGAVVPPPAPPVADERLPAPARASRATVAPPSRAPTLEGAASSESERLLLGRIALAALDVTTRGGPRLDALLEEARRGGPGEVLSALEARLREDPAWADALVELLALERDPSVAFALGRCLAPYLDDAPRRWRLYSALMCAGEAARAEGLIALLGRPEPDAAEFLLQRLEGDKSARVRARAAAVLGADVERLPAPQRARSAQVARSILRSTEGPVELGVGAAELLGGPGAAPGDLELLERTAAEAADPRLMAAALYGLAAAGGTAQARAILERRAPDLARAIPGLGADAGERGE